MDFLLVEHAIVAAVFIWLINKAFSLGLQGTPFFALPLQPNKSVFSLLLFYKITKYLF